MSKHEQILMNRGMEIISEKLLKDLTELGRVATYSSKSINDLGIAINKLVDAASNIKDPDIKVTMIRPKFAEVRTGDEISVFDVTGMSFNAIVLAQNNKGFLVSARVPDMNHATEEFMKGNDIRKHIKYKDIELEFNYDGIGFFKGIRFVAEHKIYPEVLPNNEAKKIQLRNYQTKEEK